MAEAKAGLVEQLRSRAWEYRHHRRLRELAANEIERLAQELADLKHDIGRHVSIAAEEATRAEQAESTLSQERAARQEAEALVVSLQAVCGAAYQLAGLVGAPLRFLDVLGDAANGELGKRCNPDTLLPVSLCECEEVASLQATLRDVLGLLDSGWLVRNTKDDLKPGWGLAQIEPIQKLAAARAAVSALPEQQQQGHQAGASSVARGRE